MKNCIDVAKYLGIPYTTANCWQLVCKVMDEELNIKLPLYDEVDHLNNWAVGECVKCQIRKRFWRCVDRPEVGCVVLLERAKQPIHIGVYVANSGGAGVLHTSLATGAMFTAMNEISLLWNIHGFYIYGSG